MANIKGGRHDPQEGGCFTSTHIKGVLAPQPRAVNLQPERIDAHKRIKGTLLVYICLIPECISPAEANTHPETSKEWQYMWRTACTAQTHSSAEAAVPPRNVTKTAPEKV
jgi:hypothetical protein